MLIGILLFTVGFFVAWFAKPNGATWRTVLPPEDRDRGPNADGSYQEITVGEDRFWFTGEQKTDAYFRARKYER